MCTLPSQGRWRIRRRKIKNIMLFSWLLWLELCAHKSPPAGETSAAGQSLWVVLVAFILWIYYGLDCSAAATTTYYISSPPSAIPWTTRRMDNRILIYWLKGTYKLSSFHYRAFTPYGRAFIVGSGINYRHFCSALSACLPPSPPAYRYRRPASQYSCGRRRRLTIILVAVIVGVSLLQKFYAHYSDWRWVN